MLSIQREDCSQFKSAIFSKEYWISHFLFISVFPGPAYTFDPEAFWKLSCGLAGRRPGPPGEWKVKGTGLLKSSDAPFTVAGGDHGFVSSPTRIAASQGLLGAEPLIQLAMQTLDSKITSWQGPFHVLRDRIYQIPSGNAVHDLIEIPWVMGHAELAADISLAMITDKPGPWTSYRAWPFIDLSCSAIAGWFLAQRSIADSGTSEVWFTWAASQRRWELLPRAASKAPSELVKHFEYLAASVSSRNQSFENIESDYNYGEMITPWNHFHLSWVADRLGDVNASNSHAMTLCSTAARGDFRASRFINRLTTWPSFSRHRRIGEFVEQLREARSRLELASIDSVPLIQRRLSEIWESVA